MTINGQNVEIFRGKDKILNVSIVDDNNNPLPISGCLFTYVVYKPTTSSIKITKTIGSGINIVDMNSGIIEITLLPNDTKDLLGTYNHECEITTTSYKDDVIFTGQFIVIDSKT